MRRDIETRMKQSQDSVMIIDPGQGWRFKQVPVPGASPETAEFKPAHRLTCERSGSESDARKRSRPGQQW